MSGLLQKNYSLPSISYTWFIRDSCISMYRIQVDSNFSIFSLIIFSVNLKLPSFHPEITA